jgi:hypothetical protein
MIMPDRDPDVQSLFEVADDSLQSILVYHFYTTAMKHNVSEKQIWDLLPEKTLPITFSWGRFYAKEQLTAEMEYSFEAIHSRAMLIFIVSTFEAFLSGLVDILEEKKHPQNLGKSPKSKKLIKWAFQEASRLKNENAKDMVDRLPILFGIIDEARRLRNLIVHRRGLFDAFYEEDAIEDDLKGQKSEIIIFLHLDYQMFKNNQGLKVPLRLNSDIIIEFSKAHIEALHVLHNSIQENYFDCKKLYSYKEEHKAIEYSRYLRST